MSGCRIGKVTLKDPKLELLPYARHSIRRVEFSWGEITFRCYDGMAITNESLIYMLRGAEREIFG